MTKENARTTPFKKTAKSSARTSKDVIPVAEPKLRKRKLNKYKSFRLQRRIPHPAGPLPSAWRLLGKTRRLLWGNKKPLLALFIVYTVLSLVLVRNFTTPINVAEVKNTLSGFFGKTGNKAASTTTVFGLLLGTNSNNSSDTSGVYQTLLLIVMSMSLIWIFRQYAAGNKPTAKMALFRGMYPLIPFLLVLLVMSIQLLPAVIGGAIYRTVSSAGLAVSAFEKALWFSFFMALVILSAYMICSSLFGLYVVTLPEMTPMKALRTARGLVLSRRLNILRKIMVLPLLVFFVLILLVVPAIYFLGAVAPWLYFILTLLSLTFLHAYLFTIYRELL